MPLRRTATLNKSRNTNLLLKRLLTQNAEIIKQNAENEKKHEKLVKQLLKKHTESDRKQAQLLKQNIQLNQKVQELENKLINNKTEVDWKTVKEVEPQQIYYSEIEGEPKFKFEKVEKFQNASMKLYILPRLEYDEYSGGYDKFFKDFWGVNKGIIMGLLKHYSTLKINYCFHVQFHKQYQDSLEYIEQVYETDNFEYYGIDSYEDKYDELKQRLTTWIQEREEGESGYV